MGSRRPWGDNNSFPQAIGLAASWNVDLASQQGIAISDEARGLANDRGNDRYLDFEPSNKYKRSKMG